MSSDETKSRNDSEAICEVVQITEVLPHPNADKLEIAKFRTKAGPTAYTCVIGKGQFRVGDYATYCGVDCVVPLPGHPTASGHNTKRWAFLASRPEYAGKAVARIRAAKLRGVYSEGLLMPVEAANYPKLGEEYWEGWQIDYYAKPVRLAKLDTSPKPNPVNAWWRKVFPEYAVPSLRKLPNLFQEGEEVVITEKIHGTNARFGWVPSNWLGAFWGQYKFLVGSRHMIKTDTRPWYKRLFAKKQTAGFYKENVWEQVAKKYNLEKKLKAYKGFVFYGEIFGPGIQDLTYGEKPLQFRVFDIWDTKTEGYLPYDQLSGVCADLELDQVPFLCSGFYAPEVVRYLAEGPTVLGSNIREGVVVRSWDSSKVAKYVGEGYRLRKTADKEMPDIEMRQEINEYNTEVA